MKIINRKNKIIKLIMFLLISFIYVQNVFAYEDALVMTNGKMTEIKIQDNKIIDVFPLITVMNDKNTIIVHPLKEGKTMFSLVKNNKDKYFFDVEITKEKTNIVVPKGFESLTVDCPPMEYGIEFDIDDPPVYYEYKLDEPPVFKSSEFSKPPKLRGEK